VSSNGLVLISINYGCHGIPSPPRVLFFQALELSIYLSSPNLLKKSETKDGWQYPEDELPSWWGQGPSSGQPMNFVYFFLFIYECSCMVFLFQYMIRYGFCLFQEKASTLMDRAGNAAQSAKESVQEVQIFSFSLIFYVFFREFILATTIACAQEYNEQMHNLIMILVLGLGWSTGDVYGTGSCWRSEECNWNEQMN